MTNPLEATRKAIFTLVQGHQVEQAIQETQSLLRSHPGEPLLLLDLARYFVLLPDFALADLQLQRVEQAAAKSPPMLLQISEILHRMGRIDEAAGRIQAAAKISGDARQGMEYAKYLERSNRLELASEAIAAVLAKDPGQSSARFLQARIIRRQNGWEKAEELLNKLLKEARQDPGVEWMARYELGIALDAMGRYDEAFTAFQSAKSCVLALASPAQKETMQARVDADAQRRELLLRDLTAARLREWRARGSALCELPRLALFVGHPRSGTTLVEQKLEAHPAVRGISEQQYLWNVIQRATARTVRSHAESPIQFAARLSVTEIDAARKLYGRFAEEHLGGVLSAEQIILDKEPGNLEYLPSLRRFFPEAKTVVALRDPRDVCLSCYQLPVPVNYAAVFAWLHPVETARRYSSVMSVWLHLREMSDDWLEFRYEDFVGRPEEVTRTITDYLALPPHAEAKASDASPKWISSPTYEKASKPVYRSSVARWRNYEQHLGPMLECLQPIVEKLGYAS